jgi:hypothetical protein
MKPGFQLWVLKVEIVYSGINATRAQNNVINVLKSIKNISRAIQN